MIDTVRLSFAALREVAPPDERSLRVDGINPGVYLGLDPAGKHHLLVESPDPPIRPSGVAALSTTHRELKIGSQLKRYLDVTCEHDDLVEVFHHFIAAVFERISVDAPDNGHVVMRTLAVWREFFSPATGRPSPDTVTGVIGELLFLRDLARVASSDGIAAWTGPKGGRHDFRSGDVALEVKTTRAHTRRVISVSGEEQFVPPDGGTLYLHFLRLEESPGTGVSLLDLIDEIVSTGVPRSELLAGLAGPASRHRPCLRSEQPGSMSANVSRFPSTTACHESPRRRSALEDGQRGSSASTTASTSTTPSSTRSHRTNTRHWCVNSSPPHERHDRPVL